MIRISTNSFENVFCLFNFLVVTTWKEPLVGYTEGIHGINGWCLASGRGILR